MTIEDMKEISNQYGFETVRDIINCGKNCGASGFDISLGEFDDPRWERAAFWHELGHMVNGKNKECCYHLCKIANEGAAWETGFELAAKHGYVFDYYSEEFRWAREQLKTYRDKDESWG